MEQRRGGCACPMREAGSGAGSGLALERPGEEGCERRMGGYRFDGGRGPGSRRDEEVGRSAMVGRKWVQIPGRGLNTRDVFDMFQITENFL